MRRKKIINFIIVVVLTLAAMTFVYLYGIDNLINTIGVNNSYLLLFLMGTFIGLSATSSSSFYLVVYTFAAGGLNPLLIGICGGLGLTIGDSIFYLLGHQGHQIRSGRTKKIINKLSKWMSKQKDYIVWIVIYIYSAFTPFPSDILMLALGLTNYPYKKAFIPVVLGNISLITILSYLVIFAGF